MKKQEEEKLFSYSEVVLYHDSHILNIGQQY